MNVYQVGIDFKSESFQKKRNSIIWMAIQNGVKQKKSRSEIDIFWPISRVVSFILFDRTPKGIFIAFLCVVYVNEKKKLSLRSSDSNVLLVLTTSV